MNATDLPPPCVDELLWRLARALNRGALDEWARGFVLGCLAQAKRRRGWVPSARQETVMRRLVAELAIPDEPVLIDD